MTPEQHTPKRRWWNARTLGVCVLLVLLGLVFIRSTGFSAGSLPYLMFLLCPIMHLLMMRGHGGHQHGSHGQGRDGDEH